MTFIQVQQSVVSHRKTLRLARLLNLDRYAVVGRLVALWSWCLDNALDGSLGRDIDPDILADVMAWSPEQGKPGELVDALIAVGFLDVGSADDPADGGLYIHDWHEHMGRFIEEREEKRAQAAERMRRFRERERQRVGDGAATRTLRARYAHVTPLEKSREEQSTVTPSSEVAKERENAREAALAETLAADAALSLVPSSPVAGRAAASPTEHPGSPATAPTPPRKSRTAAPVPAPIPIGSRVPDPMWDACIAAMGLNGAAPSNRVERGKWAKGIQALKESLAADGSPPSEIGVRAARYRSRFGSSVPLNPMALAGNWTVLAHDIPQEDHRHGNVRHGQGNVRYAAYAQAGRRAGGRYGDGRSGKPAVGTPEYYAQAAAQPYYTGHTSDPNSAANEGRRDAVVGAG